jgi:hypothetical protein
MFYGNSLKSVVPQPSLMISENQYFFFMKSNTRYSVTAIIFVYSGGCAQQCVDISAPPPPQCLIVQCFFVRECIHKFPDWPPGARTANGTDLCHQLQLYRCFVSQSSEFCRHNPLCCFSTSVYCYFAIDSVRKLLDILSYISDSVQCAYFQAPSM